MAQYVMTPIRAARFEHGTLGKMRIAEGGLDVGMAGQSGNDAQAPAAAGRDRRVAVPQIVKGGLP